MAQAMCYKCGKVGHKAYCCPTVQGQERADSGNPRRRAFKGKCRICKKKGHKANNFFEEQENAGKRPTEWKTCLKGDKEIADTDISGCNWEGREVSPDCGGVAGCVSSLLFSVCLRKRLLFIRIPSSSSCSTKNAVLVRSSIICVRDLEFMSCWRTLLKLS